MFDRDHLGSTMCLSVCLCLQCTFAVVSLLIFRCERSATHKQASSQSKDATDISFARITTSVQERVMLKLSQTGVSHLSTAAAQYVNKHGHQQTPVLHHDSLMTALYN
jgi:hypothetical protein